MENKGRILLSNLLTGRRRWFVLTVLATAQFMVILDATIVNVALPAIQSHLDFTVTGLQWVMNAYILAFGGLMLLGGRVADLVGRRRIFLLGLVVFVGASFAGGLSSNGAALIGARVAQGIGAALLSPAALSIVTTIFPAGRDRNTALGIWGALAGLGGTLGVILGGVLVNAYGWGSVFFVNVPIGLVALAFAMRLVPESEKDGDRHLDVGGAVTATFGALLLVYSIVGANQYGWTSFRTDGLLVTALSLFVAFVAIEQRATTPLVPLRLFRSRSIASANVGQLLTGALFISMFFLATLSMQNVLGYSALRTGFAFVPMGVAAVLSATISSGLTTRFGAKRVYLIGAIVAATGLWSLSHITPGGSYFTELLPGLIIFGLGLPMCFVPTTIASQSGATAEDAGASSGLVNAVGQIGSSIGLAVIVTVASARTTHLRLEGVRPLLSLANGFHVGYLALVGIAAISSIFALTAFSDVRPTVGDAGEQPAEVMDAI